MLLDGEKYYPLPYDWHELVGYEKPVTRKGGAWLTSFLLGEGKLYRPHAVFTLEGRQGTALS